MGTVTISKSDLRSLLIDVVMTENDIDLFLYDNYQAIRFSSEYLDAKKGFDEVFNKIKNMLEK